MNLPRLLREGFFVGLIGAGAVALWFLVVDTIAGRALFTPAMLGSAVFLGLRDPGGVVITFQAVIGYTMLHVLAFCVVGVGAALLVRLVESFPTMLFLVVVMFAIFEAGFYILVAVLAEPLLGALAWSNVAVGNLIAAGGMGYFLWRTHPKVREGLAAHPLGETMDGE